MFTMEHLVATKVFGNSLWDWLIALAVALVVFGVLVLLRRIVRRHYKKLLATDATEMLEIPLEVLSRTSVLFMIVVSLFVGAQMLELHTKVTHIINSIVTIGLFWQAGLWVVAAVSGWLRRKRHVNVGADKALMGSLGIIGFIASAIIWALVLLLTLDNLGVNISALVAGLGIGGVAVALALQNILGDLFASLSITLDKPFVEGDSLTIDDVRGTVEYIGVKSTRLRSVSGEQIIMANSDILKSRVRNYGRMRERRAIFATTISYDTPIELVERIPAMIKTIVLAQKDTRFDRCHFAKHGDSALEFETVYYALTADYNRYMDIQQNINLTLHREFDKLDIQFEYPVQKILIGRSPPARSKNSNENKNENATSASNKNATTS